MMPGRVGNVKGEERIVLIISSLPLLWICLECGTPVASLRGAAKGRAWGDEAIS